MKLADEGDIASEYFSDIRALPAPPGRQRRKARDTEASFVYAARDGGVVKAFRAAPDTER